MRDVCVNVVTLGHTARWRVVSRGPAHDVFVKTRA
jgi:hypothetical protein